MKRTRIRLIAFALTALLICGCEKAVIENSTAKGETEENGTGGKDVINPDTTEIEYLSVAEAQAADIGEIICVKGFIVASCTRSMKNADFKTPFEGSTAIILADEAVDLDFFQYTTDENLFPVCLTDYKDIRAALNLEDHPELWNKQIFITGVKARYMSCPGMKKVLSYQIVY